MLQGQYSDSEGNQESIYCGMQRGKKKHFKRGKKEYRRLSEHLGFAPVILVSPSDISIIEGASEERRHLIDVTISQHDKEYVEALTRYGKALQERNALLKKACDESKGFAALNPNPESVGLIEIYEEEMAKAKGLGKGLDSLIPANVLDNVDVKQVKKWVREERLFFTDDSPVKINCEGCGVQIATGRFCDKCRKSAYNSFDNIVKSSSQRNQESSNSSGGIRMHTFRD